MKKICEYCKNEFEPKHNLRLKPNKYCSIKCHHKDIKGKSWDIICGFEKAKLRADKISRTMKEKIARGEIQIKIPANNFAVRNTGGKTLEELYGVEKANRIKKQVGVHSIGNTNSLGRIMPLHEREARVKYYEEHPEAIAKIKEARAQQIFPVEDTAIEVKIQNYLKELQVDFFTHHYIKDIEHSYRCDIFIPAMELIIECDGNYWHKYPIGTDIDNIRTRELIAKGFKVLRLWESEIKNMSKEDLDIKMSQFFTKEPF
jgi:very-short-patch-repair endonuclease